MTPKPKAPNRIRLALLVFVFVYPLVTAVMYGIFPLTTHWAIWQRTLVMAPIIVVMMVFVIVPFIQIRLKHLL